MNRLVLVLVALLPLVTFPSTAAAQKLEPGRWTGMVVDPGGSSTNVTYDVTLRGDTIGIVASAGEHGTFEFNEVKLADDKLTFWFTPGPRVECTLSRRDDGSYAGPCVETDGSTAQMVMSPPTKPSGT